MGDWRDFEEGRSGISIGKLPDGESVTVFIDQEPYLNTEEIQRDDGGVDESESLRVPCIPVEVSDDFTDMNDDEIETVDDPHDADDPAVYDIINSSSAFKRAMRDAFPEGVDATAATVTITARQSDPNDPFTRSFDVEA